MTRAFNRGVGAGQQGRRRPANGRAHEGIKRVAGGLQGTRAVPVTAPAPARILVVEDDPEVRELLEEHLTALGHQTVGVASAHDALAMIEPAPPDLILTDVNLGGMTGVELCARIKLDPRLQLIPVVILTAVADLDARVAGLAAGADDFFAKPFNLLELEDARGGASPREEPRRSARSGGGRHHQPGHDDRGARPLHRRPLPAPRAPRRRPRQTRWASTAACSAISCWPGSSTTSARFAIPTPSS